MTDGYDCYQNALAERVNGILKTGFLLTRPQDLAQARTMVNESVETYNRVSTERAEGKADVAIITESARGSAAEVHDPLPLVLRDEAWNHGSIRP